jgi:hypothetical protein
MSRHRMFTIYQSPDDYPGLFVVRAFLTVDGEPVPEPGEPGKAHTLVQARALLPQGLVCFPRDDSDPPSVVEIWI